MSEVTSAPVKKTAAKKPAKAMEHPPVATMVSSAITELKDRKGSSLAAIKKHIAANNKVDVAKLAPFIKKFLKKSVADGKLLQVKGTGAAGSFKLAKPEKVEKPKKVKTATPKKAAAKKPVAKKPTAKKTPKKAAKKSPKKAAKPKAEKIDKKPKTAKPKKPAAKKATKPTKATPKKAAPKKKPAAAAKKAAKK
jgi:histone H1/5